MLRALIATALATSSSLAISSCASTTPTSDAASSDTPGSDAPGHDTLGPDAGGCDGELELGRCLRIDGTECIGLIGEPAVFTPVEDGGPIPIVIGHQGSRMLSLGARGRGFAGGDPSEPPASRGNPYVEVFIEDGAGVIVAVFRSRLPFAPDPADPALLVQPGVFIVVDEVPEAPLLARATLRDAAGLTRCGTLRFLPVR